ncbi:hypothetical protein [Secundilactobacillus odoratitofui]|uniref:hypothetical protein n=1 Tax=Secundilactobacillus odoratitofui TaxID=480930 RepID=UPI0006D090C0|nr:hypothetical protein [Secundilactobacillus odoratitofui]
MAGRLIHALAPHQPEATTVVVILSAGARLFDADGDLIKRTAPHEQLKIEAEVVDEKGRHYYQLDPDRFVLKKRCHYRDYEMASSTRRSGRVSLPECREYQSDSLGDAKRV